MREEDMFFMVRTVVLFVVMLLAFDAAKLAAAQDERGPGDDIDRDDPALASWAAFDEVPPVGAQVLDGVSDVSW